MIIKTKKNKYQFIEPYYCMQSLGSRKCKFAHLVWSPGRINLKSSSYEDFISWVNLCVWPWLRVAREIPCDPAEEGPWVTKFINLKTKNWLQMWMRRRKNLAAFLVSEMKTQPGEGDSDVLVEETIPVTKENGKVR